MEQRKAEFLKLLTKFFNEEVYEDFGIACMEYRRVDGTEYAYVHFSTNSVKRFSINGDNELGILTDFVKFVLNFDDYNWIF